jgi:hypothetical protein
MPESRGIPDVVTPLIAPQAAPSLRPVGSSQATLAVLLSADIDLLRATMVATHGRATASMISLGRRLIASR